MRCWRRLTLATAALAMTTATITANGAGASGAAPIPAAAFGMHLLGAGVHPYPGLGFGAARVWDMGVTWADLQPTPTTLLNDQNPAVQRLDHIVQLFTGHGVRPLIVLGMTPSWAVDTACHAPAPWPAQTCGPTVIAGQSPAWSNYVLFLATRYHDVDFEVWNEPNLRNGWNDTLSKLATLQQLASEAVHAAGTGDTVVSPGIAVTAGSPLAWLRDFLQAPGGRDFDEVGIHLYPIDAAARRGYGPEWSVQMLAQVRRVLSANGVTTPIWDTEVNVGRYDFRHSSSRAFTGMAGAAMVARTYLLQLSSGISRAVWAVAMRP